MSQQVASSQEILEYCKQQGLDVTLVGRRFRFKRCPSCGNSKWKVWFYEANLLGSCFRCHTDFCLSYFLYLSNCENFHHLFGDRPLVAIEDKIQLLPLNEIQEQANETYLEKPITLNPLQYFRIDQRPKHEASKYAISRGVPETLFDQILIDVLSLGVTFLVHKELVGLVGFQTRLLNPNPYKTHTMRDFKTGQNLIVYEREEGEIFVCEGPFNAVTAFNWGHTGICTFGSNISLYQIEEIIFLARNNNKKIICAFDMDDAGHKAYLRMKDSCAINGIEVLKAEPEVGNDLNDAWKAGKSFKIVEDNSSLETYLGDLCRK